jgi:CheY-like chemotaxis protein
MKPFRILIVDDQGDTRRGLRACLETLPYNLNILDVPSGEEAILVNSRQPFDLLVVDVRLPGISGLELIEHAQIRNPNLRIVLITGLTDPLVREQIANAKADAYFFKPFEMNDFLDVVRQYFKSFNEGEAPSQDDVSLSIGPSSAVISERLARLRTDLKADCALLISETSEILAQTWVLPAKLRSEDLVNSTMSMMYAIEKVSAVLGSPIPNDLTVVASESYDFALKHVGQTVGLLVIGSAGSLFGEFAGSTAIHMQSAASDLLTILSQIDGTIKPIGSETNSVRGISSSKLEIEKPAQEVDKIFDDKTKIKSSNAVSFWEKVAEEDYVNKTLRPDAITYDQARQLGLAPDEE